MTNFDSISSKYKGYKASLTLSIIILLIIFVIIVTQILRLQTSGKDIVSNIKDNKALNVIVVNLYDVERKYRAESLSLNQLEKIRQENKGYVNTIQSEFKNIDSFLNSQNNLFDALEKDIKNSTSNGNKAEINELFQNVNIYKNQLLNERDSRLKSNINTFEKENIRKPIFFVVASLISLIVILFSFYNIYLKRREINEKSSILDSILENTNDIANFYKPIYDDKNNIVDFVITYASKASLTLTDVPYESLLGNKVSKVYPFLISSGMFQQLIYAFENQSYFEKTIEVPFKNEVKFFSARYVPVKAGLQVMITDLTSLFEKQNELEKANESLYIANSIFQEAEEVASLGSYIWYLHEDRSIMSDNVYRILGYEPQSFEMSAAKFREFTHKDDLNDYDAKVNAAYEENKPIESIFRVITNNRKIKYIHTKGAFSERNGEQVMVGVVQDVSKSIISKNKLKAQNLELSRRNSELDSFNRVASHDLQEPLRKIQMFVSRIRDSEKEQLTSTGQKFFSKIEGAASRMRNLIDNLLAYSRIDTKDYEFESVDLNEILDNVKDTLSESISDFEIELSINKLPQLQAIPFLMEQLFTNLIGNSIKYRSTDRATKIAVESTKVHSKQIPQDFIKTHAYYHRIKITDNGIGFNVTDSTKIFQLFQRLHSRSSYSGTGLGLAICKKIVEKHHGYIYATSLPDKGAIFTIYLPSGKLKLLQKSNKRV